VEDFEDPMAVTASHPGSLAGAASRARSRGLMLIAAFKLFKGLVLLAVAIGALRLVHRDVAVEVARWADAFRVDPRSFYFHRLLQRFAGLNDKRLKELSAGTFFYAALLLTEGTGLAFRKRWAEYFTTITTSSFLPLEVYEIAHRSTVPRVLVLILNIGVVVYLVAGLRRRRESP
jgi:uncharacterized membrane protein (DUF2068 family)